MTGRWCSLVVRGVRRGWLSYLDWEGSNRDILRERLLLDDIEAEMLDALSPFYLKASAALHQVLPWSGDPMDADSLDGMQMDFDKMYNEGIKANVR